MTVPMPTARVNESKPTFLYDDCCPLCRGYTATFTALGWADRAAFSQVDNDVLEALDMDTARHHIPLHDDTSGQTQYGLDGILGVVSTEAPLLGALANTRPMRRVLDAFYWFITYNRRHIVTAAPPADGFDCAPDFNPKAVATYVGFCGVASSALAVVAGPAAVAGAACAGGALVAGRDDSRGILPLQAAGHAGSVTLAAAIAGAATKLITGRPDVAMAAVAVTAARKIYLRRWMRTPTV